MLTSVWLTGLVGRLEPLLQLFPKSRPSCVCLCVKLSREALVRRFKNRRAEDDFVVVCWFGLSQPA